LNAGAQAVRAGGTLVYSTCTISALENERQIDGFLESHHDFSLEDLSVALPAYRLARTSAGAGGTVERGALLTLPHRDRTAGFFIARLSRS
jgi:16S rRNA (cytosine967-C5)-methyltransferase